MYSESNFKYVLPVLLPYIASSFLLSLCITIVIFMIIFTVFVIHNRVQWQVLRALLMPWILALVFFFNVLILNYHISFLYYLLLINGFILKFVNNDFWQFNSFEAFLAYMILSTIFYSDLLINFTREDFDLFLHCNY